jgi:hypothetical protein
MWKCKNCGEAEIEDSLSACYKCGYGRDGSLPVTNQPANGAKTEQGPIAVTTGIVRSAAYDGIVGGNFMAKEAILLTEAELVLLNSPSTFVLVLNPVICLFFLLRLTPVICLPIPIILIIATVMSFLQYFRVWQPFINGDTEFLKTQKSGLKKRLLASVNDMELDDSRKKLTIHLTSGKKIARDGRLYNPEQLAFLYDAYRRRGPRTEARGAHS